MYVTGTGRCGSPDAAPAVAQLRSFLERSGHSLDVCLLGRRHVEEFLLEVGDRCSPATVANRYRALQAFFKFVVEEGELAVSPMAAMSPPRIPERPVPVLTLEEIRRLLKATDGRGLVERRDNALIRLMFDTGMRRAELGDASRGPGSGPGGAVRDRQGRTCWACRSRVPRHGGDARTVNPCGHHRRSALSAPRSDAPRRRTFGPRRTNAGAQTVSACTALISGGPWSSLHVCGGWGRFCLGMRRAAGSGSGHLSADTGR